MDVFQLKDAIPTQKLRERFGEQIVLLDEQQESIVHRIMAEFSLGEHTYAILQSVQSKSNDEYDVYRVSIHLNDEPELETIEDDDEWETVAEIYDEMMFSED